MTIKPEPFDTLFLELGETPVDLTENDTILPWPPDVAPFSATVPVAAGDLIDYSTREIFIQCIAGSARWRESDAAPAASGLGHILATGDGVVIALTRRARSGRGFWIWRATAGTTIAISPAAAAPVRDATFDSPVEPTAA